METILDSGKKRPPDRIDKLVVELNEILDQLKWPVWMAGKSMGGRVSSLVADHKNVRGVIALGYPFHPVGKPEKLRTDHLEGISKPMMIIQGTRDAFGKPNEVCNYSLSDKISLRWLEDGDHSLKTLKRSQFTEKELLEQAANHIEKFIQQHA